VSFRSFAGILTICICSQMLFGAAKAAEEDDSDDSRQLILAHYMPWYEAKPVSPSWGWHWTMNAFDPDKEVNGRRQIASQFYPLIGPYDSGDPHVLECQLLQMKLAGIDGVIVDWYGLTKFRDYPILHRNTQRLVEQATRLGMKFAICYEDQTIPALVEAGQLSDDRHIEHAMGEIQWLAKNWYPLRGYVRLDGRPILLSFGHNGLTDEEWTRCLADLESPVAYFSEHYRRSAAIGAFDWPIPQEGLRGIERFRESSKEWPTSIPVAFPRFVDIYAEAKVHKSWGRIEDDDGKTFKRSMDAALSSRAGIIQIATWNDWGEGTVIEPSLEFGYRDLEVMQQLRRKFVDARFPATADDLRLPMKLLTLRRHSPEKAKQVGQIVDLIATGNLEEARSGLRAIDGDQ